MPKAVLVYDLPEEHEEYKAAYDGIQNLIKLEEFGRFLRNKMKYTEMTEQETAIWEEVRAKFWEVMSDE